MFLYRTVPPSGVDKMRQLCRTRQVVLSAGQQSQKHTRARNRDTELGCVGAFWKIDHIIMFFLLQFSRKGILFSWWGLQLLRYIKGQNHLTFKGNKKLFYLGIGNVTTINWANSENILKYIYFLQFFPLVDFNSFIFFQFFFINTNISNIYV